MSKYAVKILDFLDNREKGVLVTNPFSEEDYKIVSTFASLKGRPNRPIDLEVRPRSEEEFLRLFDKLPKNFFDPFNRIVVAAGFAPIRVEPDLHQISLWNNKDFIPRVVGGVSAKLIGGYSPIVPLLVAGFLNLECESLPEDGNWEDIDLISIPGSRTFDRVAEGFRAYLNSNGKANIMVSGRAPYYDESNAGFEVTEAGAMAAYLRLLGVPKTKIIEESLAQDTAENANFFVHEFSKIDLNKDRSTKILLVTSPFHLARYRFNTEVALAGHIGHKIYAIGSKASRYWAETYFVPDVKSGYGPEDMMKVVFNEYVKIAFDLCAENRKVEVKNESVRVA